MPEDQESIVERISALRATITGAEAVVQNIDIDPLFGAREFSPLGKAVVETRNGWSPVCDGGGTAVLTLSCLRNGRIDLNETKYTSATRGDVEKFHVREGDFYYSRGNTPELVALAGIARDVNRVVVFPDLLTRVSFDEKLILPEFAAYLFNSRHGRRYFGKVPMGASPSMVKVSQDYMAGFRVPFLGDIERQQEIITALRPFRELVDSLTILIRRDSDTVRRVLDPLWEE